MADRAISHTTVQAVLRCERLPRWGQMELVVDALQGNVETFQRLWIQARDAEDPTSGPASGGGVAVTGTFHGPVTVIGQRVLTWPLRVGIVPALAAGLQTRHVATDLMDVLDDSGTAVVAQVLSGLGGVGKTQVAVGYAHRAWTDRSVDLLVWITAASREAVIASYAQAAADVIGAEDDPPESAAARFLAWLAGTDRRWLIVLDDLQTPTDLAALWPPITPTGRVLVTTRRRDAALVSGGRRMVDVGLFTSEEARAYLTERLRGDERLLAESDALAADLGYLPLALAQAAAYMLDRRLGCAEYRWRLADQWRRLDSLMPEASSLPDDHRVVVSATWSLSIELANALNPVGLARPMLQLTSVLAPNGIPAEVLTAPPALAYLTAHRDGAVPGASSVDVDQARDALYCLHRLNLLDLDPDSPARAVRVHSLVQRATRDRLYGDDLNEVVKAIAPALLHVWPEVERDREVGEALRTNASALHDHGVDQMWASDGYRVLFRAGASLGQAGYVSAAATYWDKILNIAGRLLGPDHPGTLTAHASHALWRGEAGDPAGAAAAYEQLLNDFRRVHGPDHPDTLTARHNLALWRGEAGDPAGAAAAYEELLVDRLRVLGPDHPHTLTTRNNLAYWRFQAGDPADAAGAYERLLADFARVLGPDHPDTLTARNNLAGAYQSAGRVAEAITLYEQTLTDYRRVLGDDHPSTLAARNNLAGAYRSAGRVAEAITMLEQVAIDFERILGPEHPATLTARANLAAVDPAAEGKNVVELHVGRGVQIGGGNTQYNTFRE